MLARLTDTRLASGMLLLALAATRIDGDCSVLPAYVLRPEMRAQCESFYFGTLSKATHLALTQSNPSARTFFRPKSAHVDCRPELTAGSFG